MIQRNKTNSRAVRFICKLLIKNVNKNFLNKIITPLKKSRNSLIKYFYYFLNSLIFEREYIYYLSRNQFSKSIEKKIEWAKLILNFSDEEYEKLTATHYLNTINQNNMKTSYKINDYVENELTNITNISNKTFYLYGPNTKKLPNIKYKNCILVLTKHIDANIDKFQDSILFLNYHYYSTKIQNNNILKKEILKKYGKIYISSLNPIKDKEFEHSKMLPGSAIGSSMALGRILYNLLIKNGIFDCIIEGYDLYLSKTPYSKYYPSLMREKNNIFNERLCVKSLADHDPLYNFLIVRNLINYINCIKSTDFLKILNMSQDEYLEKLGKVRDFSLLK